MLYVESASAATATRRHDAHIARLQVHGLHRAEAYRSRVTAETRRTILEELATELCLHVVDPTAFEYCKTRRTTQRVSSWPIWRSARQGQLKVVDA